MAVICLEPLAGSRLSASNPLHKDCLVISLARILCRPATRSRKHCGNFANQKVVKNSLSFSTATNPRPKFRQGNDLCVTACISDEMSGLKDRKNKFSTCRHLLSQQWVLSQGASRHCFSRDPDATIIDDRCLTQTQSPLQSQPSRCEESSARV
jgi:hypothetical protein